MVQTRENPTFRFVILGDRTGEPVPGVYEQVWRETNADHPNFVISVGDAIQGGHDERLNSEWSYVKKVWAPYRRYLLFLVPGNHDVWSDTSAQAFRKNSGHPLHYSFDFGSAHFTVLDNSRTDSLSSEELSFLTADLQAHRKQSPKFVFFHRPSWIIDVLLQDHTFPLQKLASQYGINYVICGHLHEMLHYDVQGVTYLSMASSGGHLRAPGTYERGWFFQHTLVQVTGSSVQFQVKELHAPFGQSRITTLDDWGPLGLKK